MSVKSVQCATAAHIMAALGYFHGERISSAILAGSVDAEPTIVRKPCAPPCQRMRPDTPWWSSHVQEGFSP